MSFYAKSTTKQQQANSEAYIASLLPYASNNGCDFVYKQSRSI